MLRVFVALGKQTPNNKAIIEDTEEVARLLAKYNCTMVQGGAKIGLMGIVVKEFQKYSQEVVMIVPEVHKSDLEGTVCKEHYIVEGESDRMRITIHTCDMMIVLPGGSGTLAELAYYNETCKSGEHNAKVIVVNTNGFYNKLFKFNKHQIKNGFMTEDCCKYQVISNAKQLEPILQQLIAEKQAKLEEEKEIIEDDMVIEGVKEVSTPKPNKKPAKKVTSKKTEAKKPDVAKKSAKEEVIKVQKAEEVKKPAKATKTVAKKNKQEEVKAETQKPKAKLEVKTKATKTVSKPESKKSEKVAEPKKTTTVKNAVVKPAVKEEKKVVTIKKTAPVKKVEKKAEPAKKSTVSKKAEPKKVEAKKPATKKVAAVKTTKAAEKPVAKKTTAKQPAKKATKKVVKK